MITNKSGNVVSISMKDEEDFFVNLRKVAKEYKLMSGIFICALGMLKDVTINYLTYPKETGKYASKEYRGPFELCGMTGNLGFFDNELFSHVHVVLADKSNRCIGGHLAKGTVNATLEVFMLIPDIKFERKFDRKTGLKLLGFK